MDTPFFVECSGHTNVAHEQIMTARNFCLTEGFRPLGQSHVHHLTSGVRWPRIYSARVGPDRISSRSAKRRVDLLGSGECKPLLSAQANLATSPAQA